MPDRSKFWSPVPGWPGASIQSDGVSISVCEPAFAWQLSGDVQASLERLGIAPACGPRDSCAGESYALRLAPGSVLLLSDAPLAIEAGWSEQGVAASELADGLVVIGIDGARAMQLMSLGSEYPFDSSAHQPAESARMLFADLDVAVARRPRGWRLHIERPWAAALWHWLAAHA